MSSLEFLKSSDLSEGVKRQIDPMSPDKIRFWLGKFECVTNRPRDAIETDGTLNWLPCLMETYAEVRRRLFGLLKSDQVVVANGNGEDVVPAGKPQEVGSFVWTNSSSDSPLTQQLNSRGWPTEGLHMLGPQFGILKGCSFSAVRQSLPPMMQSSQREELLERIASVERAIAIIEEHYPKFDNLLTQNSEFISPHLRARIHAPAELVELNRNNPMKNGAKAIAEFGNRNIKMPNPRMFMYQKEQKIGESGFYAAFETLHRSLFLGADIENNSLREMCAILHELVHADQGAAQRNGLSEDEYMRRLLPTPTRKGYCLFADECAAWALELEGLNAVLHGSLQRYPIDFDHIAKTLQVEPRIFKAKAAMAENYFARGRWKESGAYPMDVAYTIYRNYETSFLVRNGQDLKDIQSWEKDVIGKTQFTSDGMPIVIE